MDAEIQRLKERFSQLEDEALLRIVGEEAADYRPEALEVAREEIRQRGLEILQPAKTETELLEPEEEEEEPEAEVVKQDWVTCALCGGGLRTAVLLADNQIIAVFEDNREARYVKVLVCPRCGSASMFVDMKTEVTE